MNKGFRRFLPSATALTLMMLVLLQASNVAHGQASETWSLETWSGGKVSENIRFIPYQDVGTMFQKTPKCMIIPRETYERMKAEKEAYLARRPASPIPLLDSDFSFGPARYSGKILDRVAEFSAEYEFEMPNERWALFALPGGDVSILEVLLDGLPAGVSVQTFTGIEDLEAPKGRVELLQKKMVSAFSGRPNKAGILPKRQGHPNDFLLAVRGPGRHSLSVKFLCPQLDDPLKNELTFRIPRLPVNSFAITLSEPGQYAEIDRSEGVQCRDMGTTTSVEGTLGATDRFTLRWAPKTFQLPADSQTAPGTGTVASGSEHQAPRPLPKVDEPPRIFAESGILFSVGEGYLRNETTVKASITRGPTDRLELVFPKDTTILSVNAVDFHDPSINRFQDFSQETIGTETRVICRFPSKLKGAVLVTVVGETKMADTSQVVDLPIHRVSGSDRDQGFIGIEARTSVELRRAKEEKAPEAPGDWTVSNVDVSELPTDLSSRAVRAILLSYKYLAPPRIEPLKVQVERHEDLQGLTSVVDLVEAQTVFSTDEKSETSIEMFVRNNGKQHVEVELPTGSRLISTLLDDKPIPASAKGSSTFLIPLAHPSSGGVSSTQARVKVQYGSPVKRIGAVGRLDYVMAKLDIPTIRLNWSIGAPTRFGLLPLPCDVEKPYRSIIFLPFRMSEELFRLVLSPEFVVLLFLGLLFIGLIKWSRSRSEPETAPGSPLVKVVFIGCIVLIAAIPFLTSSGGSVKSIFGSIDGHLERAKAVPPMVSQSSIPEEVSSLNEGYAFDKSSDGDFNGPGTSAGGKYESKKDMAAAPMKSRQVLGKGMGGRQRETARDRGALPVDRKIVNTGQTYPFSKHLIKAGEAPKFRGLFIWQPLELLLYLAIGLSGILGYLLLLFLARRSRGFIAGFLVILFALLLNLLEERVPGGMDPAMLAFGGCFLLTIAARVFSWAKSQVKNPATLVMLLILSGTCTPVFAENPPPLDPRVEQVVDVFIPYSQLGERLPKDSPLVFLKDEDYAYLRDLGIPEPDPARWTPPVSVVYVSCQFIGHVVGDQVEITMNLVADLLGKGFKKIPFPQDGVGVRSLLVDGNPAVLLGGGQPALLNDDQGNFQGQTVENLSNQMPQQMVSQMNQQMNINAPMTNQQEAQGNTFAGPRQRPFLVTKQEGRVVIEAKLVKDLISKSRLNPTADGFRIALPPFGPAVLDLAIDKPGLKVEVLPSTAVRTQETATGTIVRAFLQPAGGLSVEWREKATATQPDEKPEPESASRTIIIKDPKVFIDQENLFSISAGNIHLTSTFRFSVEQAPCGEFDFSLPPGFELIDVSGTDIASWSMVQSRENATGSLRLILTSQKLEPFEISIDLERQTRQVNGEFDLGIPWALKCLPKGTIERQKGFLALEIRDNLVTEVTRTEPGTRVDRTELPPGLQRLIQGYLVGSFKYLEALRPRIQVVKHQDASVSTAQIDGATVRSHVTRDGKILSEMALVVRNNNNQFLLVQEMPKGMSLLTVTVNGDPVKPGIGESGEVFIPLIRSPQLSGTYTPFGVTLTLEEKTHPLGRRGSFGLRLPRLSVEIAAMNWRVFLPEDFFLMKAKGDFEPGWAAVPGLPGTVRNVSDERFSNVMTQSRRKVDPSEGQRATGGILPVTFEFPETPNSRVFNKTMINSDSSAPALSIAYAIDTITRPTSILLGLLVALILAGSLSGLAASRFGSATFGLVILGLLIGTIQAIRFVFEVDLPFMGQVQDAYLDGLRTGAVIFVAWYLMSWKPETPVKPKENTTPATGATPTPPQPTATL